MEEYALDLTPLAHFSTVLNLLFKNVSGVGLGVKEHTRDLPS